MPTSIQLQHGYLIMCCFHGVRNIMGAGEESKPQELIPTNMVSSALEVFRICEESLWLWGSERNPGRGDIWALVWRLHRNNKALDSSSSLCTSKCHLYQVALDHSQSSSIYLFCRCPVLPFFQNPDLAETCIHRFEVEYFQLLEATVLPPPNST